MNPIERLSELLKGHKKVDNPLDNLAEHDPKKRAWRVMQNCNKRLLQQVTKPIMIPDTVGFEMLTLNRARSAVPISSIAEHIRSSFQISDVQTFCLFSATEGDLEDAKFIAETLSEEGFGVVMESSLVDPQTLQSYPDPEIIGFYRI